MARVRAPILAMLVVTALCAGVALVAPPLLRTRHALEDHLTALAERYLQARNSLMTRAGDVGALKALPMTAEFRAAVMRDSVELERRRTDLLAKGVDYANVDTRLTAELFERHDDHARLVVGEDAIVDGEYFLYHQFDFVQGPDAVWRLSADRILQAGILPITVVETVLPP